MANFKSDIRKQQESSTRQASALVRSKVRQYDFDLLTTGLVQNDTIELVELVAGDYVMISSNVAFEALGASTTISIGTASTPTKYVNATSTASASNTAFNSDIVNRTRIGAGGEVVYLTIGGANPTTAKKIKVSIVVSGV